MKHLFFLVAIIGITHLSCSRNNSTDPVSLPLAGKWRMILVTERSSGVRITKPASIQKDVDLVFSSTSSTDGTLSGNTPSNVVEGNYVTGANRTFTMVYLSMTKVGETSWGSEFIENIHHSQEYSLESGDRLNIKTTGKILTFKKL